MTADMKKERLQIFDIAKGIAIICVILGHLGNENINRVVFTFHVPIFFMITGYFISTKRGIFDFVKSRIRTLIVPYIVTCIVIILIGSLRDYSSGNAISSFKTWSYAAVYGAGDSYVEPFFIPGIGAIWFLWATFWGSIFLRISLRFNKTYRILFVITLFIAGYYSRALFWFPLSIQAGACATLFMYLGNLGHSIKENIKELPTEAKIFGLIFASVTWFFFMKDFQSFWLVHCDVGRGIVDIFGSICGCIVVLYTSKFIEAKLPLIGKPFAYIGKYSLLVLCIHILELHFFPCGAYEGKLIAMGLPEKYKLIYTIIAKLILDIGCACIISRSKILKKIFGYQS